MDINMGRGSYNGLSIWRLGTQLSTYFIDESILRGHDVSVGEQNYKEVELIIRALPDYQGYAIDPCVDEYLGEKLDLSADIYII